MQSKAGWLWKMKPMRKCFIPTLYIFIFDSTVWKESQSLCKNDPSSDLIYELSKLIPNDFMVLVASFKSSSIQNDVHFINYGPIYSKIDDKAEYALGRDYLVIDRLLPRRFTAL